MKILIVEDDANSRVFLERALLSQGYMVESAANGVRALEKATLSPPDLIISDIMMPEMDGFELCRKVKTDERLHKIPFVFYTATYIEDKDEKLAMALGASRFLIKPMEPEEFFRTITKVIEEQRAGQLPVPDHLLAEITELDRMQLEALARKLDKKVQELEEEREALLRSKLLLHQTQQEWEDIFQAIGHPTIILDAQHNILSLNKATVKAAGAGSAEELTGRKCYEIFHNAGGPPKGCPLVKMLASAKLEESEMEVEAFGGVFLVSCTPVFDEKGNLQKIIHIARDITEHKLAEEALHESEERYRTMFENSLDAILLTIPDGKILSANPAACSMFGRTEEEICALGRAAVVDTNDPRLTKLLEERARTGRASGELTFFRKDGSRFPGEISSLVFKDAAGNLRSSMIIRDITERKQGEDEKEKLNAQLLQAQKMEVVGQLAGGIAHDFNNILTAMIGYGHLIKMKLKEDDPLRIFAEQILSLSDKAANLTQSLLAFSRKRIMNPCPINLNEIIKRIDYLLSRIIGEDIKLQAMLSEEDLIVMADSGQIEQALMNLATNARDAMPEGGFLTIGTEKIAIDHEFIKEHGFGKEGEYALISVTDTGAGMDRETREKIFEPFFTTKEVGKGTGLGLSMVYGIVKQHEGYINVYSEPGSGTTFRIYLPLIEAESEEIKPEAIQTIERGTETVLLAEDEEAMKEFTKKILEEYGYKVIAAGSGQEAIDEFKAHKDKIQLLLFDVIMPNRNGREAYEEIRKIRPGIKVLFMSGYPADIIHKHDIIENGFAYIEKPVSPAKLLKKIREVLGQ